MSGEYAQKNVTGNAIHNALFQLITLHSSYSTRILSGSNNSEGPLSPGTQQALVRPAHPRETLDVFHTICRHKTVMQFPDLRKGQQWRHCVVWDCGRAAQVNKRARIIKKFRAHRAEMGVRFGNADVPRMIMPDEGTHDIHRTV